jgi:DNA replication and repair protein RecF
MKGRLVSDFGSQGQQRLLALALRIVEARLLYQARGDWPVLLIDDVTHSLDDERRALFHQFLPKEAQRLITLPSARPNDYPADARLISMGK